MADNHGRAGPAAPGRLSSLAKLFFRLGCLAFGGPAAHIAMMEDEVVRRRGWLDRDEFLDLVGATNLIPGPNSSEMAMHVGWVRGGLRGLVVAGVAFILPAAVIVVGLAWAYVEFGTVPQAGAFLYGVKPVVIAVVALAIWRLGKPVLAKRAMVAIAAGAVLASVAGLGEIAVLLAAGIAGGAVGLARRRRGGHALVAMVTAPFGPDSGAAKHPWLLPWAAVAGGGAGAAVAGLVVPVTLTKLFLFFLKVGSVLFGGGYVLFAFIAGDLVHGWGWLSEAQLVDAIAVGQFTPGPILTTATFVGYLVAGPAGAVVATVGIFLPSFVFVALSGPIVPRIRASAVAAPVLDGVNAGALALMAVVTVRLAMAAVIDLPTALLAIVAAGLLARGVGPALVVLLGGVAGLLLAL